MAILNNIKNDNSEKGYFQGEKKLTPYKAYNNAKDNNEHIIKNYGMAVIGIEVILACFIGFIIIHNNFHIRVSREIEKRKTGQITLNTGVYAGNTDFGYFDGIGNYAFNTGASYQGDWQQNHIIGKGELLVPIEGHYTGEFVDSMKNGIGIFEWDDGSFYDGGWENDTITGQGVYVTSDNIKYSGSFIDNSFQDGTCEFSNSTGVYQLIYQGGEPKKGSINFYNGITYDGEINSQKIQGTGKMVFANSDVYEGAFIDGCRSGSGKYTWINGDIYDGQWVKDQIEGIGVYTFENGAVLQGNFLNNMFMDGSYHIENDFGDYSFTISDGIPSAVEMTLVNGTEYTGEMDENGLNGHAQIKYSNGDKYDGNVKEGQKDGQGVYNWTGGASYDGAWDKDKMCGNGIYKYAPSEDGYKLVGSFIDNKPYGDCEYYVDSTTHYSTKWESGKCVFITE